MSKDKKHVKKRKYDEIQSNTSQSNKDLSPKRRKLNSISVFEVDQKIKENDEEMIALMDAVRKEEETNKINNKNLLPVDFLCFNDSDWSTFEKNLNQGIYQVSDFFDPVYMEGKGLNLLFEKNIPLGTWKKLLIKFPEIQPLANGYSKTHPLVVAASKDWISFERYLKDSTFKPKQFTDIIQPINGIDTKYQNVTKDMNYQNDTSCGDGFSVFGILYITRKDDLLQYSRELALKHPINVLWYLDIDNMLVSHADGSDQYRCFVILKRSEGNKAFSSLYLVENNNEVGIYEENIFDKNLKSFFKDFAKSDFSNKGFELDIENMNNISTDEEIEILLYAAQDQDLCDSFQQHCEKYLKNEKAWFDCGFTEVKNKISASFFGKKLSDDVNSIIASYCLPKP